MPVPCYSTKEPAKVISLKWNKVKKLSGTNLTNALRDVYDSSISRGCHLLFDVFVVRTDAVIVRTR